MRRTPFRIGTAGNAEIAAEPFRGPVSRVSPGDPPVLVAWLPHCGRLVPQQPNRTRDPRACHAFVMPGIPCDTPSPLAESARWIVFRRPAAELLICDQVPRPRRAPRSSIARLSTGSAR